MPSGPIFKVLEFFGLFRSNHLASHINTIANEELRHNLFTNFTHFFMICSSHHGRFDGAICVGEPGRQKSPMHDSPAGNSLSSAHSLHLKLYRETAMRLGEDNDVGCSLHRVHIFHDGATIIIITEQTSSSPLSILV